MLQQQQNLGRRFGTSKMHLSPPVAFPALRSKAVVLLLLIVTHIVGFCNFLRIVVRYFMSILVLQSSQWGRERAGCFALFVFVVPRDCYMTLPDDATGCLQFVIVVFPDHTHLLILNVA